MVPVRIGARAEGVSNRGPSFQRIGLGGEPPAPELVPIRHGTLRDGAIAVVVLVAPAQVPAAPRVIGPVVLPAAAFDPAPASCVVDVGWRICVLSASGGQALRNVFDPHAAPLEPSQAPGSAVDPAVVLATAGRPSASTLLMGRPPMAPEPSRSPPGKSIRRSPARVRST